MALGGTVVAAWYMVPAGDSDNGGRIAVRWLWLLCVLVASNAAHAGPSFEERPVGVKIYEYDGDFAALFNEWQALGINSVFASVGLNDQPEFRQQASLHNIKRFVIVPTFFNSDVLQKDPSLYAVLEDGTPAKEEWVEFVSPANQAYRKQHLAHIRDLVIRQQPDGLSIDFIRYFAFWEQVPPDADGRALKLSSYDAESLHLFQTETGVNIQDGLKSISAKAAWIAAHHAEAWTSWRVGVIASMVRDIAATAKTAKPDILINLHLVPWRQEDFAGAVRRVLAQDVAKLAPYADMLSPMTYSHMTGQDAGWVQDVVADIATRAGEPKILMPSIQAAKAYWDDTITPEMFEANLQAALKPPSNGVSIWSWQTLKASPEKKAIFRQLIAQ